MSHRRIDIEEQIVFVQRHVEQLDTLVRGLFDDLARIQGELSRLRLETQGRFDDLDRGPETKDEIVD